MGRADIVTFEGLLVHQIRSTTEARHPITMASPSANVFLPNMYDSTFDFWTGWALSNVANSTTPGFLNQYAAFPGRGGNGSDFLCRGLRQYVP